MRLVSVGALTGFLIAWETLRLLRCTSAPPSPTKTVCHNDIFPLHPTILLGNYESMTLNINYYTFLRVATAFVYY